MSPIKKSKKSDVRLAILIFVDINNSNIIVC